jgi:hypothetical protein
VKHIPLYMWLQPRFTSSTQIHGPLYSIPGSAPVHIVVTSLLLIHGPLISLTEFLGSCVKLTVSLHSTCLQPLIILALVWTNTQPGMPVSAKSSLSLSTFLAEPFGSRTCQEQLRQLGLANSCSSHLKQWKSHTCSNDIGFWEEKVNNKAKKSTEAI